MVHTGNQRIVLKALCICSMLQAIWLSNLPSERFTQCNMVVLSAPTCCVQCINFCFFLFSASKTCNHQTVAMASLLTSSGHDTLADTSTTAMHCTATKMQRIQLQLCERLLAEQPHRRSSAELSCVQCLHGHFGSSISEKLWSEYIQHRCFVPKRILVGCSWHPSSSSSHQSSSPSCWQFACMLAPLRVMLTRLAK